MPAFVVVGLGYGDEGKGAVVDHLVRQHKASGVVFFNGGAQRAHNVVTPDGRHHTFTQFSSGTLAGAMTYHSQFSLVNPGALFMEGDLLEKVIADPWRKIAVHKNAKITTPFHVALNRFREYARREARHGSCGMGIGETVQDALNGFEIRAGDLLDPKLTYEKLHDTQMRMRKAAYKIAAEMRKQPVWVTDPTFFDFAAIKDTAEIYRIFAKVVPIFDQFEWDADENYVFEGSQGALLHEFFGFHPYTTWSDTSSWNAQDLLTRQGIANYKGEVKTIGVMRSYMTRHGAGPFVTEDPALATRFPEAHNGHGEWQGSWRVGWTDLYAIQRGIAINNGIDELAITHMDRVAEGGEWKICNDYDVEIPLPFRTDREDWLKTQAAILKRVESAKPNYMEFGGISTDAYLAYVGNYLDLPITVQGYGPTADHFRAAIPA